MKTAIIRTSSRFAQKLKEKHNWFNENIARAYFKKDISFTDFTDMLADGLDDAVDLMLGGKILLYPIKRGRKSKKVKFDLETIPI